MLLLLYPYSTPHALLTPSSRPFLRFVTLRYTADMRFKAAREGQRTTLVCLIFHSNVPSLYSQPSKSMKPVKVKASHKARTTPRPASLVSLRKPTVLLINDTLPVSYHFSYAQLPLCNIADIIRISQ